MLAVGFNAMLDRIDQGVRRLSEFSADLAHEMRTPVATLLGRTQVALSQSRSIDELHEVLPAVWYFDVMPNSNSERRRTLV